MDVSVLVDNGMICLVQQVFAIGVHVSPQAQRVMLVVILQTIILVLLMMVLTSSGQIKHVKQSGLNLENHVAFILCMTPTQNVV
jgi:hypothetical protein